MLSRVRNTIDVALKNLITMAATSKRSVESLLLLAVAVLLVHPLPSAGIQWL